MITYNQYCQLRVRRRALAVTCLSWGDFLGKQDLLRHADAGPFSFLMSLDTPGTKYHLLTAAVLASSSPPATLFLVLFLPVTHSSPPTAQNCTFSWACTHSSHFFRQCQIMMTLDTLQKGNVLIASLVFYTCHSFSDIFFTCISWNPNEP